MLTVLVTACATPITGTPYPAGSAAGASAGGGLPLEPEQRREVALFAQMRSWDMCAMHDIAAAERATGFAPDELLPYREPGICRLVMRDSDGVDDWELQLDIFHVVRTQGGGEPIDVGGVQMPRVRDSDESRCAYSYPIGSPGEDDQPWGIEVSVFSIADNKQPCDVAREYATAIAPQLADPPLRSAGGTTPPLDIAASDPCAVAAAMVPVLSGGQGLGAGALAVGDLQPYGCGVNATVGDGSDSRKVNASVEFTIASARDVGSTTVGGFPAARSQLGINCKMVFAPSAALLIGNPEIAPSVPSVEIVSDCNQIDALAEAAAGAIAPATGAPRPDAQALGDLNPPPTAESAGSPFDPCTVVGGWQAYPADVQPPTPRPAVPLTVGADNPFKVGCRFNAGDLYSSLVWGMPTQDGFTADPAARGDGAVAVQFGGRPGVEQTSTNSGNGEPTCYSAVQISQGIAAMVTTLPDDPCRVNRAVLEQVAQKVP
jgi:hypothetical protein